jgi:integrase
MLTTDAVKKLTRPARGSCITYDNAVGDDPRKTVSGFGARITARGHVAFVLNYRAAGIERRLTIGSYPTWAVARARKRARELRLRIDQGEDPLAERQAERTAPTMRDLAQRYREEYAPRKRSRRDDYQMLDKWVLPALGEKRVADVRYADIVSLHAKITKAGSPIRANRCAALLSKMFALSIRWQWRDDNPARAIERNPENPRNRYLTGDELERLVAALSAYPNQQATSAVRLLLLTGSRRMEVLSARWTEFDFEKGNWRKPSAHTKTKRDHVVPLSAPALQLLASMPRTGPYVFPGRGEDHLRDIKTPWAQLCKAANIEGLRLHDLRHSFASILVSSGASLPLIGALLGHVQPGTTQRYSHLFDEAQRAATERVAAVIMGSSESGEVVPMQERARR